MGWLVLCSWFCWLNSELVGGLGFSYWFVLGLPSADCCLPVFHLGLPDHPILGLVEVDELLGLEEAFDVEFPERMLNRKSFASIDAIGACIAEIAPLKAVA